MRRRWRPAFAAHYGLKPWELDELTAGELAAIEIDLRDREAMDGPQI